MAKKPSDLGTKTERAVSEKLGLVGYPIKDVEEGRVAIKGGTHCEKKNGEKSSRWHDFKLKHYHFTKKRRLRLSLEVTGN